jgi:NADH-dependent peroxiredoxin subunit F
MFLNALKSYFGKRQQPAILDKAMMERLGDYLTKLQNPVELVASLDDSEHSRQLRSLLDEIATQSDKIHVRPDGSAARTPSFSIARAGEPARIGFAGLPLGHEFNSLVLALLQAGGHPPRVEPVLIDRIRSISARLRFETFITLNCHNCPDVVQALNLMALVNPGISHMTIDGMLFKDEIARLKIDGIPAVYLNGEFFERGRKTLADIIASVEGVASGFKDSA